MPSMPVLCNEKWVLGDLIYGPLPIQFYLVRAEAVECTEFLKSVGQTNPPGTALQVHTQTRFSDQLICMPL
jgi:hypothetical protein